MHSWKPSGDLLRDLDRETGSDRPNSTMERDRLHGRQQTISSLVNGIPSQVRGSTPDSATSVGKLLLKSAGGEEKYINTRNLQNNAENKSSNQIPSLSGSTRAYVSAITSADEGPRISSFIEMQGADEQEPRDDDEEKHRVFWPKCLLLLVAVMMALAGIAALVVLIDKEEPEPRGRVVPDPIIHDECVGRSFYLGDVLNFTCIFDTTHEFRKILTKVETVVVIPKGKVLTYSLFRDKVTKDDKDPKRYLITISGESRAKCSSAGAYDVIFKDASDEVIHSTNVEFTIKADAILKTTMEQRVLTDNKCLQTATGDLETVFDVSCNILNDCNSYHTTIYRRNSRKEESLNQYLKCERNYTDDEGYMVKCSASLPDKFVEDSEDLGCKMETTLKNNKRLQLKTPFKLPECGIVSNCKTGSTNSQPFNCSKGSTDIQKLVNAECGEPRLKACLKPERTVFSVNKDRHGNLTCSDENIVPVCRLSWCANYTVITKNQIPGKVICSVNNEPYVSPTTTSSTTTSTEMSTLTPIKSSTESPFITTTKSSTKISNLTTTTTSTESSTLTPTKTSTESST